LDSLKKRLQRVNFARSAIVTTTAIVTFAFAKATVVMMEAREDKF